MSNGISIHVLCNTVVTAPPLLDPVFTPLMSLIVTAMLTAATIIPMTFISIWRKLDQLSRHLSKRTIQLQKMLLMSLFIQAVIHGVMLGAPLIGFIYAIVFILPYDSIAYCLLLLISFHGSFSTIAMIFFTKPVRDGVKSILKFFLPFLKSSSLKSPSETVFVSSLTSSRISIQKDSMLISNRNSF
ncbi:hypothetical protein B9Z55_018585 [Caenorhabditis nigoni]|nr:hypothetical protein B9Z55_018585 [Caenorhabditis nigoni]